MKAETYAETYVAISKMSNEEVNNLLRDLVGPNKDNVPNAPNLPLTPQEMERINQMRRAGKDMPLTIQDKKFLTDAVRNAKKRKVNKKRTAFQQALNKPRKVENPVKRAKRLGQTQQPAQTSLNPKQQQAMEMFNQVQENKRRRLAQQQQVPLPQKNVPLPKTPRTMSNEEMQRRMKARRKREQSQQQPQQQPQTTQQQPFPPAPPREIPFPPPSQQPQQTQRELPPRVKSLLQRKPRRVIRRKQPVTVNPKA